MFGSANPFMYGGSTYSASGAATFDNNQAASAYGAANSAAATRNDNALRYAGIF